MLHHHFIKLLRLNAGIALGVCLLFFVLAQGAGWHYTRDFFALFCGVFGLAFASTWGGHYRTSAWILYLGELSGMALINCLFGREYLFQIMFLLLMIFPFLYFQGLSQWWRSLAAALPFPVLILLEYTDYSWWPREVLLAQWAFPVQIALLASAFLVQWVVMYFYGQGMQELAKAKVSLNHQKEMAEQYKVAKEFAEKSEELKSFLLTAVSHEFRTPLHSISLAVAVLKENQKDVVELELLDEIGESSARLSEMLGDIMDLACLRSGQYEAIPYCVDMYELLHEQVQKNREAALARGLEVIVDAPQDLPLWVDGRRVAQFTRLILDNAIKFSTQGQIKVHFDAQGVLEICDQGPGLSVDLMEQLQETFVQGQGGYGRNFSGLGIGLSLAACLAQVLSGQLSFHNRAGGGLRVRLALPVQPCLKIDPIQLNLNPKDKQILIVEDQVLNAKLLATLLNKLGYQTQIAENGQVALDLLAQFSDYQLIFMDLQMPVMDGFSCTQKLREMMSRRVLPRIPIVAISANATDADRIHARAAGMDEFISKPISKSLLEKELPQWFLLEH